MTVEAHLSKERGKSTIISAVLSGVFFSLLFGFKQPTPVWGIGNYVFDFAPQSFVITLMSCLVPGITTGKAVLAGKFTGVGNFPAIPSIIGRAAIFAAIMSLCGVALAAIILKLSGMSTVPAIAAFIIKLVYGGTLGSFATGTFLNTLFKLAKKA